MPPLVIPIFIAQQGCPHRCIFCDQHTITAAAGTAAGPVTPAAVRETIEQWLRRGGGKKKSGVQVAFYGGSFTGLPRQRQRELLGPVRPYVDAGLVDCLRVSTRPDYIDAAAIGLLREYGVAIVELGLQSLDGDVLAASSRGHSVQQSKDAVKLLQANGFTVGAQLMCGLPRDTTARLMATARKTAALRPDFVRIYPALVIQGSGLEKLYRQGEYKPLSLARAVALCCRMKSLFDLHGIRVVRMGLQPSAELAAKVVAGPYHPAFGELVRSRALFTKARKILRQKENRQARQLSVAAADESVFRGPGNVTLQRLAALNLLNGVELVFNREQRRNTVAVY